MNRKKIVVVIFAVVSALILIAANEGLQAKENIFQSGDVVYTKPVKGVIFSHKLHVDDRGLSCDMCHSGLFEPSALKAQGKPDFVMESLYRGKYCGACHNGTMAFASNTQCARCHIGVKGYNAYRKMKPEGRASYGPKAVMTIGSGDSSVKFNHGNHMQYFQCNDCHAGLFPMKKGSVKMTMKDIYDGKYCGSCHDGKKAFVSTDCAKCHAKVPAPKNDLSYSSKGLGAAKFSHNTHAAIFKCEECHPKLFAMKKGGSKMKMDVMYSGGFCGSCHDGKKASAVTDCAKCHKN
jgi:c(7)-type cytochrome triheme protein